MKKFLLIVLLFCFQLCLSLQAKSLNDYSKMPYVGTEINKAANGDVPFVLIIADPNNHSAIIRYFSIGKMIYRDFENKYDFCILNANSEENKDYIEFFKPDVLPEVYVVNPQQNTYGKINKKYHNVTDMKRILKNVLDSNKK